MPFSNFIWFMGVVEDTNDPLKINRLRVRCIGFHSDNKSEIATEDLPWAPMLNSTASMSAPILNQGDWVVGFFIDGENAQQPVVLGSITGIPTESADINKGFYDPDGIFPRSGQIKRGTNSPLARGELGIPTGVPVVSIPQQPVSPSTTTPVEKPAETPSTPSQSISGGVYIGDSIAVQLGTKAKQTVNATGGKNTDYILQNHSGKSGSTYTVICAGTNDGPGYAQERTESNLRKIRASISNAPKVIFIVPYTNPKKPPDNQGVVKPAIIQGTKFATGEQILNNMRIAAAKVRKVAAEKGDITIELDNYPTIDGIHPSPSSATRIVKDIEKLVGKTPSVGGAPTAPAKPTANPSTGTKTYKAEKGVVAYQIGLHESKNNYNVYNNGDNGGYTQYFADRDLGGGKDFSKFTVRQHLAYKNEGGKKNVFAMGRWQIIPYPTMNGIYKAAGLTLDSFLTPENQDKLYNYLLPKSVKDYVSKKVADTPENINRAVFDIAKIWASVGVPYPVVRKDKRKGNIQINTDQSYWKGAGPNRARTTSEQMREALRRERGGELSIFDATYTELKSDDSGTVVEAAAPLRAIPVRQNDEDAITYTRRTGVAGVKTASGLTWNEPSSQYAAVYPKNHVMETAGGHVLEFDDTDGAERINIFHKAGSFIEMHPDGKVVFRSRGSMNQITYGDGNIYIRGNYNITSTGDVNILSNKATNISTVGDVNWKVGGNFNLDVQGEAKLISGKMFLEGSELRINEGTAGIGAPEASDAAEGAASAVDYAQDGEFIGDNTNENVYGEQSKVTEQTETAPDGKPVAGGSVSTKLTDYGVSGSNIDFKKKISKHFTLFDLTHGTVLGQKGGAQCKIIAKRGITVDQQIKNLSALAQVILDPLKDAGLTFQINQGYRINDTGSDHCIGCAADLGPTGGLTAKQLAEKAYKIVGETSKQFLLEYTEGQPHKPGWVHIAYNSNGAKSGLRVASATTRGGRSFVRKVVGSNFVDLRKQ